MLIGYVVSGAVLCVWAELIMLATNRTEAVINESRAELYMYSDSLVTFVELIGRVERSVSWSSFSVWKRERDDIRIGTYLCTYSNAEPSVNIICKYSIVV